MVFRRDNKVDSFQRQMSALRNQLGTTGVEQDDVADDMPELDDVQYERDAFRERQSVAGLEQDSGAYSFGTYPGQAGDPRSSEPVDAPDMPEMPQADGSVSVIARENTWKGDISSGTSIQIFGKVEGTLTAREDIWVAEGAEVDATLTAQRVIVAGSISGTVNASSRFEALPSGNISADVSSPISVVHEGATINGRFKVGPSATGEDARPSERSSSSVIQRRTRPAS